MKTSYVKRLLIMSIPLLLIACGGSGPSKSDAEEALDDLVSQLAQFLGGKEQATQKVKVADIKCEKKGEDIFDCQVLLDMQGQQVPDRYQFTKLDGKWRAKHLN